MFAVDFRCPPRQKPIASHSEEDARLTVLEYQQHRRHRYDGTKREQSTQARQAGDLECSRQGIRNPQLIVTRHSREHGSDDDIDDGANRQSAENAKRQIPLWILRLLGRGRDRVEADVCEEHDRRALMNTGPTVRRERMIVLRIDVHRANDHE